MTTQEIDRLRQFLGAYFHQDWLVDASTWEGIVDRFVADHRDGQELAELARLLEEYSVAAPSTASLGDRIQDELWCNYRPETAGVRADVWLRQVAARLRASSS